MSQPRRLDLAEIVPFPRSQPLFMVERKPATIEELLGRLAAVGWEVLEPADPPRLPGLGPEVS